MKSFATAAFAATLLASASAKKCQNITVPVDLVSRNGLFDKAAITPHTDIDVTNLILDASEQGVNYTAAVLKGYATIRKSYKIEATYCAPDSGTPDVVQILTHGIGFDRSYWDIPYNNFNYSYVNEAVDQYGYATFSYDRLGLGMSSHGEPVNEIQTPLEVAALKTLTDMIRAGSISGVPKYSKAVHVGHSFGSFLSYAVTSMYPTISNGLGLTGFSQNSSFVGEFELGGNFVQANKNKAFSEYPDGYLAPADVTAVQVNFFGPGDFDPKILPFAFKTGEPVTVGELLTMGAAAASKNVIKAPVIIITGERDIPFCGGNCYAAPTGFSSIPATSKAMLPNASPFQVKIINSAGHGLNLQYSHPETYGTLLNFFTQNGLSSGVSTGMSAYTASGASASGSTAGSTSGSTMSGMTLSQIADGQVQAAPAAQESSDGQVTNGN